MPRITQQAGFEWGGGDYINPVAPEQAAAALRAL
jgi:UDPglucose--hexose-1-phosphate uridylyltransferase